LCFFSQISQIFCPGILAKIKTSISVFKVPVFKIRIKDKLSLKNKKYSRLKALYVRFWGIPKDLKCFYLITSHPLIFD